MLCMEEKKWASMQLDIGSCAVANGVWTVRRAAVRTSVRKNAEEVCGQISPNGQSM